MAQEASDQGTGRRISSRGASRLRSELLAHAPSDEREVEARSRILEALDTLERPFDEDADPVHVTGSAVVVGRRGTVLHVHRRLGRWMQPGGHVDPGETPADAALRESREETGLDLSHPSAGARLIHVDVHSAANGHTHLDLRYLLLAPDEEPSPPAGESPEVRWCTWEEAETLSDVALVGALRVAQRQPEVLKLGSRGGADRSVRHNGG
ncbi:MAG TPA: NUDIX domain-containing protein [Acidimicrobiales bacterium]|nr:NUDIX domain-containing protein [Acidimicrobiales bacterium]